MMHRRLLTFVCFLAVSIVTFVPEALARKVIPIDTDPSPAKGIVITVRDERAAVSGAHVWVESAEGRLLAEGITALDGRYTAGLSDSAIAGGVSITASAPGHSAVSFLENVTHRVNIELPRDSVDSFSTMTGLLTGFKESDDETKAQAGIVAKALEMSDLANLDPTSLVSPLKDTMDVFGPREIPSNLVLPDQTFPVYFIPVHVDKPTYRLPVLTGSSSRYFGVTGAVNVQEAINIIRGDNTWDIINLLEFQKVGLTKPVPVPRAGDTINLDFATDVTIRDTMKLKAGRNTGSPESRRLAVAVWEPLPGTFVPTDVKLVQSDDFTLSVVESRTAKFLDVLVSEKGDRYRGNWLAGSTVAMPDAGLTADLTFTRLDTTWLVSGGEDAQLMIAHVENDVKNSVGGSHYEDRWVVVGPRKAQLRLPASAFKALEPQLGKIDHVSVDLLRLAHTEYPFISEETSTSAPDLSVLEKVRKKIE